MPMTMKIELDETMLNDEGEQIEMKDGCRSIPPVVRSTVPRL